MDKAEIAKMIKEARLKAGLTQKQLGEKTGMFKESISRLESGKKEADIATLRKIAKALDCDLKIDLEPKP